MSSRKNGEVWMFHYVKPITSLVLPHLNYCKLSHFIRILDWAQENFDFLNPEECLNELSNNGMLPEGKCLLTFDDGTRDHWEFVYPELLKRNLSAIFFVPTGPILNAELLKVHMAHVIYGSMGYDKFFNCFKKIYSNYVNNNQSIFLDTNSKRAYPYDNKEIAGFKYAINFLIDQDLVVNIYNNILKSINNIESISNNYYLTKENLIEMKNNGMCIGYHGHSHQAFSTLPMERLIKEFEISKEFFVNEINVNPRTISYPYGDKHSVNNDQIEVLKTFGINSGFLAEPNKLRDPMKCERLDCIELTNKIK